MLGLGGEGFELAIVAMFQNEWRLQGKTASLRSIAIIDTQPEQQYLYPEFVLAKAMLERHGIDVRICDPAELTLSDGSVRAGGRNIDLVYNRLVDFTFGTPAHDVLRRAYAAGAVVVTPGPHTHALLANKRNLVMLSDLEALRRIGADQADIAALSTVPRTEEVTLESAPRLWSERKRLFFKPLSGHGGKAVYRGDKLTKSTWAEITKGDYIAQELVAPGQRMVEVDHAQQSRKMDVRLYTYDGKLLVAAARLYQGQTTNFRTLGHVQVIFSVEHCRKDVLLHRRCHDIFLLLLTRCCRSTHQHLSQHHQILPRIKQRPHWHGKALSLIHISEPTRPY